MGQLSARADTQLPYPVIDADVHNAVANVETLFPYLEPHWREYLNTWELRNVFDGAYPPGAPTSVRPDLRNTDNVQPAATLESLRTQALDPIGAEYAILNSAWAIESIRNPDLASAVASAANDWTIAEWLNREPRLRASLSVPSQFPELAAQEIDRIGDHPGFVQVALPVRSAIPYGNRVYYPVLEAAIRRGLALGIHFGGMPGNPPTGSGWPSWYLEEYAGMANVFQVQLLSLIAEGTFERFPQLRVAFIEGGFAWLPAFMWRLDKEWRGLRREVPWVRKAPSEYVRTHVRLTVQPNDGPAAPNQIAAIIDQLGSDELLMFSTDYPHWHPDASSTQLFAELPDRLVRRILSENGRAFYALDEVTHA